MTRTRNITVLGGILLAGISLANVRADVTSAGYGTYSDSGETFFPDDNSSAATTDWGIELLQHAPDTVPTPVPPPPNPAAQAPAAPPQDGPYPATSEYGPNWTPPIAAGPGCYDTCGPHCAPGCDSCCGTGCCPGGPIYIQNGWRDVWGGWLRCCPTGLVAGVEGTFLVPVDEPDQRVIFTDLVTDRQWSGEPHGSLGGGVRTWIGLQKCGWGVRARYWHFGNDNVDPEPEVPVWAEPTIVEAYHLEANVLDLELTQRFCLSCCWQIDTSFGARYANLERYMQVNGFGQVGGVDLYGLAMGANDLEGTGFTASIGGTRQIHPCSGWFFFWNFRGSVLWADTTASALTDAVAFTGNPPASANARNHANSFEDKENVFILDTQVGIEYRICTCRCGQLAFRGGIEYQHWDTGDLIAQSESFAFLAGGAPPFGGESFASADGHDGDLDLIGFIVGVEWTY